MYARTCAPTIAGPHKVDRYKLPVPLTLLAHCLGPPNDEAATAVAADAEAAEGGAEYPPCQSVMTTAVHLAADSTVGELLREVGDRMGVDPDRVVLTAITKSGGAYQALPLYTPVEAAEGGAPLLSDELRAAQDRQARARRLSEWPEAIFDQAEVLMEDATARRTYPRSLAEAELRRRNLALAVTVRQRGQPDGQAELDGRLAVAELPAALGLREGEVVERLDEATGRFEALAPAASEEAAARTLLAAGLGHGSVLRVKSASEATLVTLRFRAVHGNDKAPHLNPERPGARGPLLEAEVDQFHTVRQAKAALCRVAGLAAPEERRLRMAAPEAEGDGAAAAVDALPVTEEEGSEEVQVCDSALMR